MSLQVLITGAAGFLGRAVLEACLHDDRIGHVYACDIALQEPIHSKMSVITGDLLAPVLLDAVWKVDVVLHLAATLGGAAEQDPTAARRINVDSTIALITSCGPQTRFVFASSLAVLGRSASERAPTMIYGCHKAMAEIALETATRRGEVDGIALRPGGIVARAEDRAGLKSAFLSKLFWAVRGGHDITLPVSADGETLLSSVGNVAANFLYAATAPYLGDHRSLTLPMTTVRFADLVRALRDAFPDSRSVITYAPDPNIMALFGQAQSVDVQDSLDAGFFADADLATLIIDALKHGEPT